MGFINFLPTIVIFSVITWGIIKTVIKFVSKDMENGQGPSS